MLTLIRAFGSIPLLLDRLFPLLHLTLQIPARTPWADLRVSYLLNLTGFLATYVTSMPLLTSGAMRRKGKEAEYEAGRVMRDVLGFLAEVERGWMAVLGGQGWVMDENEEEGVKEEEGEEGEVRRRLGHGVPVDFAGSVGQTERYAEPIRLKQTPRTDHTGQDYDPSSSPHEPNSPPGREHTAPSLAQAWKIPLKRPEGKGGRWDARVQQTSILIRRHRILLSLRHLALGIRWRARESGEAHGKIGYWECGIPSLRA